MTTDNIVVAIKSRPLIEREKDGPQWIIQNKLIYQANGMLDPYTFDYIYNETYKNEAVYNEIVKPLVHSCLSGFNATIFAYGQTSSGKTHTIMGNEKDQGIVALAINDIFKRVAMNSNRQYLIRCSFFELYNEKLYDLIHLPIRSIRIREDSQGNVNVDADEVVVKSCGELMDIMAQGSKNKKIASTKMNKNSSRSHTIFRIIIESKEINSNNLSVQVSQLNLVDLAGSERLAQTESTGIRLAEGVNINKSLLALGKVIRQLCDNEGYVNYRDSKLTRILKASLGGNAKCLVIAAITVAAVEETKSTLEFAQRAKKVKNKPTINEITSTNNLKQVEMQYSNQLKRYRQQILELENELNLLRKIESDVKAVMSFKSTSITPITNRRHTICAVKDTYERSTYPCHTPISTDKQFFHSNFEQGSRILETISEPQEYIDTSTTSDINITNLDTGQEHIKTSYIHENEEDTIYSAIKMFGPSIKGRRILESIPESESISTFSTSTTNVANLDTSQNGIEIYYTQDDKEEEKISSPIECSDDSIEDDTCDMDETLPSSTNSTPKYMLRKNLAALTAEYEDLQRFTSYELTFSQDRGIMEKMTRIEDELINLKKCETRPILRCQKCHQLQKNIESKPDAELKDINELWDISMINENEPLQEISNKLPVSQINLDITNKQINKQIKLEENEKRMSLLNINGASEENEKCIDKLNAINLILNQRPEDANEIIHYIYQQLVKLKDILEKPPLVDTKEVQTDILQIIHVAAQTQHGDYLINNTQSQMEGTQQREEIVHKSVCTQTENYFENPSTTQCNEEIDLLQITCTSVQEQSQRISTIDVDTQTDINMIPTDFLQVNHIEVQTEYERISTNSANTQTENENQDENKTQTKEIALTSVCVQTDNDVKEPPAVQCSQVQTDLLPTEHAAVQTQYQGIPIHSISIQTITDQNSICIQTEYDESSKNSINTQTENKMQSEEISVCVRTDDNVEEPPTVRCVQVQTDLLQTEHAEVQTQCQGISIHTISTPTKIAQNAICVQTEYEETSTNSINTQTDIRNQVENKTQTEEIALTSMCTQTDNKVEEPPTVHCIQVQTDLLQTEHAEVQTQCQGISIHTISTQTKIDHNSICVQTEYEETSTNSIDTQTEIRNQVENKTQTEEIALTSMCTQTDNNVEEPPTVHCIQVQTDLLQTEHAAVQTQCQGISIQTQTKMAQNSICIQTEYKATSTNNINTQTEGITQKESKTQTVEIAHISVCTQTETGLGLASCVQCIRLQTDMLKNHVASASRISPDTVQTQLGSATQKGDLSQEATCTRRINDLENLHSNRKSQEFKGLDQHMNSTNSPIEKRKQKLHEIYDNNRRISSEFSKEDVEIIQEDLGRYQKEKEEELSKLKKELDDLKENNAILNDEVEYFMKENEEMKILVRQLEKEEEVLKLKKELEDQKENNVMLNDEVEYFMRENEEMKIIIRQLEETQKKLEDRKCIKCDEQKNGLTRKEISTEKPSGQKQHCTACALFTKQLQTLKSEITEKVQQILELQKNIFELKNTERKYQQQLGTLTDESEGLKRKNELLKVKYKEIKKLYLDQIGK